MLSALKKQAMALFCKYLTDIEPPYPITNVWGIDTGMAYIVENIR